MVTEQVRMTFNKDGLTVFLTRLEAVERLLSEEAMLKALIDCEVDIDTASGIDELTEIVKGERAGMEIEFLLKPTQKALDLLAEMVAECPVTRIQ